MRKTAVAKCTEPQIVMPVIDRNRCEGKEDCLRVCPHGVFEMATLTEEHKAAMSFIGKLKARVHGNRQAFVVEADACHACGLCVTACPEGAIRLVKVG
jgi:4Fe-4S ferredoxin